MDTRRALIVDDSRTARLFLRRALTSLRFEVIEAPDGTSALAELERVPVDVGLIDWNLPGQSGLEIVRDIRSGCSNASVPIVMVTRNTDFEYVVEALNAGADEYLMKPFSRDALAEKLELIGLGSLVVRPGI